MTRTRWNRYRSARLIGTALSFLLAIILLTAVVGKIRNLEQFARLVSVMAFVPQSLQGAVTIGVPLVELVIACFLLLPKSRQAGLYGTIVVLAIFTAFLIYQGANPYLPDCQCFGLFKLAHDSRTENQLALLRNAFLVILAVGALGAGSTLNKRLDRESLDVESAREAVSY
ncbi:hypothetical protein BH09PLA1_BH09PLA1_13330 [soil metagenome]